MYSFLDLHNSIFKLVSHEISHDSTLNIVQAHSPSPLPSNTTDSKSIDAILYKSES